MGRIPEAFLRKPEALWRGILPCWFVSSIESARAQMGQPDRMAADKTKSNQVPSLWDEERSE